MDLDTYLKEGSVAIYEADEDIADTGRLPVDKSTIDEHIRAIAEAASKLPRHKRASLLALLETQHGVHFWEDIAHLANRATIPYGRIYGTLAHHVGENRRIDMLIEASSKFMSLLD